MNRPATTFLEQISVDAVAEEVDVFREGEDYRAFGVSRKAWGGEPFLNLIGRDGRQRGKPWAHVDDIEFDPSTGIVISFARNVVIIKGQCLREMYEKLIVQRVVFIREADHAVVQLAEDGQTIVTQLAIEDRGRAVPFDMGGE